MCVCLGNRKPSTGNEHEQCFICSVSCRAFFHYIQLCFSFFFTISLAIYLQMNNIYGLFLKERELRGSEYLFVPLRWGQTSVTEKAWKRSVHTVHYFVVLFRFYAPGIPTIDYESQTLPGWQSEMGLFNK